MESAVEALKMAAGVMVFVLALSMTIATFSQARETSEMVLQSADGTIYYDYIDGTGDVDAYGNRIVGFETIIPNLYKYNKERYRIEFKQANGNDLVIYSYNKSNNTNKAQYTDNIRNTTSINVSYFDITEESNSSQPWTGSPEQIKLHLDAIISGTSYIMPSTGRSISYSRNALFTAKESGKSFVEQVRKIPVENESGVIGNNTTTKTIITYTLYNE